MTDKAVIQAEFEDVKRVKTRKCWQLIFEVPEERYDDAMEALGGSPRTGESRPVAIALLKPGTKAGRLKGGERAKRAGILCGDPAFQLWLRIHLSGGWALDAEQTAAALRIDCKIRSRAELDHNEYAARRFDELVSRFYASQRGQTDEDLAVHARRG